MGKYLINNARIFSEGESFRGNLLVSGDLISEISTLPIDPPSGTHIIDAEGKWLLPGAIDDQVHFREPGLTHKGEIATESSAAAAGGVTSYMEMPNTIPQTTTIDDLKRKFELASEKSVVNYSFYLGATNDNIAEIRKIDPKTTCGVKVFMGASTGNMLVDNRKSLSAIFAESPVLIATHCEDEETIRKNVSVFKEKYGENVPISAHPLIRSAEACYISSSLAVELAEKYQSRLHILHISTARELELFRDDIALKEKRITAEVCVHHLYFDDSFYESKGSLIKWNPAIKSQHDREALFSGLLKGKLDVIATDHAPHTLQEKMNSYFQAPSGGPMVQHSLVAMLEFCHKGLITPEKIVEKMCHAPADLFRVHKRGYLRRGYYADMVIVDPATEWTVKRDQLLYKCGWSPMEGRVFHSKIETTFVNGEIVYEKGEIIKRHSARQLEFKR